MCFSELANCSRIFRPNEKKPKGNKLQVTSLYWYLRHIGRLGMVDKRWIYGGYTSDIRLTCVRCTAENWNLGHHKKGSYDSRDHPSVLNYFKIKVRNSLREERIELNPGLSFFSKLPQEAIAQRWFTRILSRQRTSVKRFLIWKRKTSLDSAQLTLHDKGCAPKFWNTSKEKGRPYYNSRIKITLESVFGRVSTVYSAFVSCKLNV